MRLELRTLVCVADLARLGINRGRGSWLRLSAALSSLQSFWQHCFTVQLSAQFAEAGWFALGRISFGVLIVEGMGMVEVTQEAREICANFLQGQDDEGHAYDAFRRGQFDNHPLAQAMQAAFNAGRASVLAELESNECICPKCGIRHGGRVGEGDF